MGGACFSLEFPLQAVLSEMQPAVTSVTPAVSLSGMKVLLAEDDATLRLLTEKILENEGAVVDSFVNGKLAYDAFDPANYDMIITDMMMPEMDGVALIKAIRGAGFTTPILAATAATVGSEIDELYAVGANVVLAKPITVTKLLEAVDRLFKE